jgi:hypothetical protein
MDRITHKPDGSERNSNIAHVLQYFSWEHLPEFLQEVSKEVGELAFKMADTLPETRELYVGLRKLIEAKDALVRTKLDRFKRNLK